jgi:hypothetical protein
MVTRILLVEGQDDQHVMWNLFEFRGISKTFEVECPKSEGGMNGETRRNKEDGGDRALLDSIPARLLEAELDCLAVVLDANDTGPKARWQSIRSRLLNAGYSDIPEEHAEGGTVFRLSLRPRTPRSVRFAAWIMPDNRSNGMLEDFVTGLIRDDDDMLPFVDQFLNSIPAVQRRYVPAHQPKARVHSWLAVSERPGRPMGQAIKADKHLDANHASVQPFLNWIQAALVE